MGDPNGHKMYLFCPFRWTGIHKMSARVGWLPCGPGTNSEWRCGASVCYPWDANPTQIWSENGSARIRNRQKRKMRCSVGSWFLSMLTQMDTSGRKDSPRWSCPNNLPLILILCLLCSSDFGLLTIYPLSTHPLAPRQVKLLTRLCAIISPSILTWRIYGPTQI